MTRNEAANVRDAVSGLTSQPKTIPTSLLYDELGSRLFESILRQPEYYPVRSETKILSRHARDIIQAVPASLSRQLTLLELGATDDVKVSYLLDAAEDRVATYIALNIEITVLKDIKRRLFVSRPGVDVHLIQADFLHPLRLPLLEKYHTLIVFFPGNTIGQFDDATVASLFAQIREAVLDWPSCAFIVGFDICRDPEVILPAYDDAAGASALFNRNILTHLNHFGGSFTPATFRHVVQWNEDEGRVEMYLQSKVDQTYMFQGQPIHFLADERVLTGVSYKRTLAGFSDLAVGAGWSTLNVWTDDARTFGVQLLSPVRK